jgi:hypothetical protein
VLNRYDTVRSPGESSAVSYHYMTEKEKRKIDFDYVAMRDEFENEQRGMYKESMAQAAQNSMWAF